MALVNCPECEHQVSDKASSCPNCGHPIKKVSKLSTPMIPGRALNAIQVILAILMKIFLVNIYRVQKS